ncbi:hypothetical protein FACS189459_1950 [Bacilli bacterium]|nr:hypothetical protein FACS189459_1950 [Bacilli bacterium]
MGALHFLEDKTINDKYNTNSLALSAYLNPEKTKKDICSFLPPKKLFANPLINNYRDTGIMDKCYISEVLKNLPSFSNSNIFVLPGFECIKVQNFENCIAMIDLQHKDQHIVTNNQTLI